MSYVYLKHNNVDKVYELQIDKAKIAKIIQSSILDVHNNTYGFCIENPMIINIIEPNTMQFIIDYINSCDGFEKEAPSCPLKNIDLSYIFDTEYELFKTLLLNDDTYIIDKVNLLNSYMDAALYFDLNQLHRKLCALFVYILRNNDISELKNIL